MTALHDKFRPKGFADVIGQGPTVKALQRMVKKMDQRAFLLSSTTPGVGKTTLARISARAAGCLQNDIREIDAATYTGVDDMRMVTQNLQYEPFGKGKCRALIVDEAHRLSPQAWDSLLKVVEEPPPHVLWFFCTTRVDKVPATIRSRCAAFTLKEVRDDDLLTLAEHVCEQEELDTSDDVLRLIVKEAHGSPRQTLVNLDICREARTKKEAAELLKSVFATDAIRELCQFLLSNQGRSWPNAQKIIAKLDGENPEGIRIVVCNWVGKALKDAKTDRAARFYLHVLNAFSTSYNPSEGIAPLLLSIGEVVLSE